MNGGAVCGLMKAHSYSCSQTHRDCFFRLLVLHEWGSDVTLPTIILVSASVSCAVAWPDFLTTDAVECQRVHAVLPHALTIAPFSFMTLNPLFLGFLYVSAV